MTEDAMRAMQQQCTTALDSLTRQNVDLQAELAQNRQQVASELAALRQQIRAPLRGSQTTGVSVDTSLLGKSSEFSGAQDAWRDWSAMFKVYAGAADATSAKVDGGGCESGSADPKRHDPG